MNIHSAVVTRDPEITKKCILDAALALFAARGFHGTNVPDVAKTAQVGAGSIYRHFADKVALVNAVFQQWKLRFTEELLNPAPDPGLSYEEQFREIWARLWRFYRKHPQATIFLDVHAHGDYLSDESRKIAESLESKFEAWVRGGQKQGALVGARPEELIAMVYGAFIGLVKMEINGQTMSARHQESSGDCAWNLVSP